LSVLSQKTRIADLPSADPEAGVLVLAGRRRHHRPPSSHRTTLPPHALAAAYARSRAAEATARAAATTYSLPRSLDPRVREPEAGGGVAFVRGQDAGAARVVDW